MGALENYGGGWNRAAARELAEHANAAYSPNGGGGTRIESERTDTQCFLVDHGTHAVLSFRGTETPHLLEMLKAEGPFFKRLWKQLTDMVTDMKILRTQWFAGGMVHRGFAEAFHSVEQEIHNQLEKLPAQSRDKLFITGHSLGGALATLAASRFSCRMVTTFGSPRVGNREFARKFELRHTGSNAGSPESGRYFRMFNRSDIVARIPLPVRFRHVGLPVFITYQGLIWPRPGCWIRLKTFFRNVVHGRKTSLLGDHGMENYLKALEE